MYALLRSSSARASKPDAQAFDYSEFCNVRDFRGAMRLLSITASLFPAPAVLTQRLAQFHESQERLRMGKMVFLKKGGVHGFRLLSAKN
jgi:hypothetical protein